MEKDILNKHENMQEARMLEKSELLGKPLSPKELEALKHIAEGKSSLKAAGDICRSKRTVDFHLDRAYRKLGVSNRVGAIREARERGILAFA